MSNQTWKVDPLHSSIHFTARHMVVSKVRGSFQRWTSELAIDDGDLTKSSVNVTIEAASIETSAQQRDDHLRSADFLDVEHFPHITFKSKRIERTGDDRYHLIGDLTIKDVTREVTLDVEYAGSIQKDPWGGERTGFTAQTAIDRKDYGLKWNLLLETGGVVVGDKLTINIEIEAARQLAANDKNKETAA